MSAPEVAAAVHDSRRPRERRRDLAPRPAERAVEFYEALRAGQTALGEVDAYQALALAVDGWCDPDTQRDVDVVETVAALLEAHREDVR